MGWGSLKDLAKVHENVKMEWAKEAQDDMKTNPVEVLGNTN